MSPIRLLAVLILSFVCLLSVSARGQSMADMGISAEEMVKSMPAELVAEYAGAVKQLPAALQQKIRKGEALTAAEMKAAVTQLGAILGEDTSDVPEVIDLNSVEAQFFQAMMNRVGSTMQGGGDASGAMSSNTMGNSGSGDVDAAKQQWEDMMHYILVAQVRMAAGSGEALLKNEIPASALVKIVEGSRHGSDYVTVLERAQHLTSDQDADQLERLAKVAKAVEVKIEDAKLELSRDPDRIRDAIERLDGGERANMNATKLLQAAGEYAAPQLVDVLLSREDTDRVLADYVVEAMVAIGHPLVAPLNESLTKLPMLQRQQVARVLGRIGYPQSLPYLKAQLEGKELDGPTRDVLQKVYNQIVTQARVDTGQNAATLFYTLGEQYYLSEASLILQPRAKYNLMWYAQENGRLSYLEIPTVIFGDVQAMRASRRSLQLDPGKSEALSLWLAGNFRRENNLPAGEKDLSYGPEMRSPQYYANLAGPRHVVPVLERGLKARDAELALDAIRALEATAGNETIVSDGPLVAALDYPDRRVRYEAAFAIARAMPREAFAGSGRVVPVLASAVRQNAAVNALVIVGDQQAANGFANRVRDLSGLRVLIGTTMDRVKGQLETVAAVDLLVVGGSASDIESVIGAARGDVKIQGGPIVVVGNAGDVIALTRKYRDDPMVTVTGSDATDAQLDSAIKGALDRASGMKLDASQTLAYSTEAVELLRDLALTSNDVFKVEYAKTALIEALGDPRDVVALGASGVLSLIGSADAQRAIGDVALDGSKDEGMRIAFLNDLAASAKRFGAMLSKQQTDALLRLVDTARGDLADAAAEAHGALNLPTEHGVELITR